MTPGCLSIGAHSANCSALKRIDGPIQACLQFAVSPAHREMGRLTRDGGTANVALKRRACAAAVAWRTKGSLTPNSEGARLQGPENAKEMRCPERRKYQRYHRLNCWRWGQSSANSSLCAFS